ncbi:MAG: DUF2666 family protein [Candidatus Micrarchaeaceae archaeon]
MEEPKEYIDFMARYKDWIAIKRIGIRDGTKPEEVSLYLSSVKNTIEPKLYNFLGIDFGAVENLARELTKGMRKGYNSLAQLLPKLDSKDVKEALAGACKNPDTLPIAKACLFGRVLDNLGLEAFASPETILKVFPELKIPKQGLPKRSAPNL